MDTFEMRCKECIDNMSLATYSRFCAVITQAQKGEITWKELWVKHLKDSKRVSLRG